MYRHLEVIERNKYNAHTTDSKDKLPEVENKYELPSEVIELQLCKLFNCLPSELDKEDYKRLMTLYAVDGAITKYQNMQNDGSKTPIRSRLMVEILKMERDLGNKKAP